MSSTSVPPVDAPATTTAHESSDPSGRSADSLPRGAGEGGGGDETGRAPDAEEGDPAVRENEDGDGV